MEATDGGLSGAPRTSDRPRTILYTGKGGVGKTSIAAATARRCAAQGLRTVVLSTDPAHSLSDSLGESLGADPTPIGEHLWGQEVASQRELEANWARVREWLARVLSDVGVSDIAAAELTVPPGMDELFSLLQIKRHHAEGEFDVVIVDCAPTGETLRLLGFPDIARWWLERVMPLEGRLLAAARPIARSILDVPMPESDALAEVHALVDNLIAMNEILRDRERASIRLVMNPDRMVIKEAQRTFTYLGLYGYLTDAVVVNRIFPDEVADSYFGPWLERQREQLRAVREGFSPVPILTARYFAEEVVGAPMLDRLSEELFAEHSPEAVLHQGLAHEIETENGTTVLRLPAPFGDRDSLRLRKIGSELIVDVANEKRTIILPSALAHRAPTGARLEDGTLTISFSDERPDEQRAGADDSPRPTGRRAPEGSAGRA